MLETLVPIRYVSIAINDLSRAIFPFDQETRLMAMLTAYFDDSGSDRKSKVVGMAGYIATDKQWVKFQRDWKRTLDRFHIPFFHASDWANGAPPFKGWTDAKKWELFQMLVGILRRTFLFGVSMFTIKEDYQKYRSDKRANAYTFCVMQCLAHIEEWANKHKHADPIAYVFDQGATGDGQVEQMRVLITKNSRLRTRLRFGSLTWGDKAILNPLQAADILAYESYKEMCNYVVLQKALRRQREDAKILWSGDGERYAQGYFDKDALTKGESVTDEEWAAIQLRRPPRDFSFRHK